MEPQNRVDDAISLNGAEAKVLLQLLRLGGGKVTNAEMMRLARIGDRQTYFRVKAKFVERGWWENPTSWLEKATPYRLEKPTTGEESRPLEVRKPDLGVGIPNLSSPFLGRIPRITARMDAEVVRATEPEDAEPAAEGPEETNWRARMAEADRMPGADSADRAHDPLFRERREAQVRALQAAWGSFFPQQPALTIHAAKNLLVAANDWSEDVLDKMEEVQARGGIQSPLTYILAIFRKQAQEGRSQSRATSPSPSLSAGRGAESREEERQEDNYYLKEPSEKTRRMQEVYRRAGIRFAGDGLGPLEDDEEDD